MWRLVEEWQRKMLEQFPPPRPAVTIAPPPRRYANLPLEAEREIIYLEVLEDLLQSPEIRAAYRPPIRRSPRSGMPLGVPDRIHVRISRSQPDGAEDPKRLRGRLKSAFSFRLSVSTASPSPVGEQAA